LTEYLVGTGGWAYFQVPGKPSLKAYSEVFDFVEVNNTFYEYPNPRVVEGWRSSVRTKFVFSVRCHQDLTHRIRLRPVDEAFEVFYRVKTYCDVLKAPFLVLETPASQALDNEGILEARNFLSSISLGKIRLVWEYRALFTSMICSLMQDFGIIQSVDLSLQKPILSSDVAYSRLFGKGKHNIYQFTDNELLEIEKRAEETEAKIVVLAYHGSRMNTDALRSKQHLMTRQFLQATNSVGVNSANAVLAEDAVFPVSKAQLIADQGWKVIDLTTDKRVHLADLLVKIPERTYRSLDEVTCELKAVV
jgi:uncharacterized protein YecE (DUF72 family)